MDFDGASVASVLTAVWDQWTWRLVFGLVVQLGSSPPSASTFIWCCRSSGDEADSIFRWTRNFCCGVEGIGVKHHCLNVRDVCTSALVCLVVIILLLHFVCAWVSCRL